MLTDEPDGSPTFHFRTGGLREICRRVFRWWDQVVVRSEELSEANKLTHK